MQRTHQQTPPGEHVHVKGAGAGLPFAIGGILVAGAGAWRMLNLLPTIFTGVMDCDGTASIGLSVLRIGLAAGLVAGVAGIVLSEIAARRHLGQARLVAIIGSVLGVFTTLVAVALMGLTFLPEFQDCLTSATP